jgi:hypothetical protein
LWAPGGSARAPPGATVLAGGHFGSVSALAAPGGGTAAGGAPAPRAAHVLASAGYDKTVRLWDARRGGARLAELRGHDAPVLLLALRGDELEGAALTVASGDRGGGVRVWDGAAGAPLGALAGHRGHVTALAWSGALLVSGAQDGHVRVWDVRAAAPVANVAAHATAAGAGAVGDIASVSDAEAGAGGGAAPLLVTAGADKRLCVLEPRAGWAVRAELPGHRDFIYSLALVRGVALSGAGDGLLIAHDVQSARALWGVGANTAAVRAIVPFVPAAGRQALLVAGDDGKALVFDM